MNKIQIMEDKVKENVRVDKLETTLTQEQEDVMIKVLQTRYYHLYESFIEVLGFSKFIEMAKLFGGDQIYIGKLKKLLTHYKNQGILDEFYEETPTNIANKYNVSRATPYKAKDDKEKNVKAGKIYSENEAREKLDSIVEKIERENKLGDHHCIEDIRKFVEFIMENSK